MVINDQRRLVILLSLHDLSGVGTKAEVLDNIQNRHYWNLARRERAMKTNRRELVWRNDFAYIRKKLVSEGSIGNSTRNRWTLTNNGINHLLRLCREASEPKASKLTENANRRIRAILANSQSQPPSHLGGDVVDGGARGLRISIQANLKEIMAVSRKRKPQLVDDVDDVELVRTAAPRDEAFRIHIQKLYKGACALCGLSLRSPDRQPESQAAHIYPKSRHGSDDLRNGLCLCRLHHWAFDVGWISVRDDLTVIVHRGLPADGKYEQIRRLRGRRLAEPQDPEMRPHPIFLRAHRRMHRFERKRRIARAGT